MLNKSYNGNLIHMKLEKPEINPLSKIIIISKNLLSNKYNPSNKNNNLTSNYTNIIIDSLMFNKSTHLVAIFKDYMIKDYIDEFLKRYYRKKESTKRIQNFPKLYHNYFKFFSSPTLSNFFCNELMHYRFEKKAECFYKKNYNNKKISISSEQDKGVCEDSENSEKSDEATISMNKNSKIGNTIFNENIRKKIDKYTPVHSSMVLPENGSKLKKNGSYLLISNSNEKSLVNIVKELNIRKKKKMNNNLFIDNMINNNFKNRENYNHKKEEKIYDNININSLNFESSKSNRMVQNKNRNVFSNKVKKFESESIKLLLNSNTGQLNSNITKKLRKNDGLLKLLKKNQNIILNSNIIDSKSLLNNNKPNSLSIDRNIKGKKGLISFLNLDLNKKVINSKLSTNNIKYNSINKINNIKLQKNATNKIQINRINSIISIVSQKQKFILKRNVKNLSNLTRNTTKNQKTEKIGGFVTENFSKNKNFHGSPSNILNFIKRPNYRTKEKSSGEKIFINNERNKELRVKNKIKKRNVSKNSNKNLEYKTLNQNFGLKSLINSKLSKENINRFNMYKLKTINHARDVYNNININKMKNVESVNHY